MSQKIVLSLRSNRSEGKWGVGLNGPFEMFALGKRRGKVDPSLERHRA